MQTIEITFAAGDTFQLPEGNFFQYLRGQDPIRVDFWRGDGKLENESATIARPGYRAEPPRKTPRGRPDGEPIGFTRAVLTSATAQTIEVGVSEGEGGYARFTGEVEVTSPLGPNGGVGVEDVGTGQSFATINAKLSGIREAVWQSQHLGRAPYTSLENTSHFSANNSTTTVVSAASNTNGVVVKTVDLEGSGSGTAWISLDSAKMFESRSGSTHITERDLYIQAGVKVEIGSNDAGAYARCRAEVL